MKVYHFFADEFFGIERTIAQLVRYFHSASLKGDSPGRSTRGVVK